LTRHPSGWSPAWDIDGELIGVAPPTLHASYLHVHWAGHPHLAQRFAEAAAVAQPVAASTRPGDRPATSPRTSDEPPHPRAAPPALGPAVRGGGGRGQACRRVGSSRR